VTIAQNAFANNNAGVGVQLASTSGAAAITGVSVTENTFTSQSNAIFFLRTSDSSISGNTITGSVGSQVLLGGGVHDVDVVGNVIRDGASRGVRIGEYGGGATNQNLNVVCNEISGHANGALEIDTGAGVYTGALLGERNFWGAASGPTIASNPGGAGDPIIDPNGAIDYAPFATAAFMTTGPSSRTTARVGCANAADNSGQEGNSGASSDALAVTLTGPQPQPITVAYATADGSATAADGDYLPTSGTLVFAPGQTAKQIEIPVVGDGTVEPDETLKLTLSNATDAVIADGEATLTIANDDAAVDPPPVIVPDPPVTAANRAPTAKRDRYKVDAGKKLSVKAPGVLAGDADPDGDALTASVISQTKHGKLKLKVNGSFKYKPAAGYVGKDSFAYRVSDGRGGLADGWVKLKVKG
jgi:hypothetical protein